MGGYECLLVISKLMIKRQENTFILGAFTGGERSWGSPGFMLIGRFSMGAHDPATGGDPSVQESLHNRSLFKTIQQANAIALPVASHAVCLGRKTQIRNIPEKGAIRRRHFPATTHKFRKTLQLFSPDRRLDISHPVVKAEFRIRLEDYAVGSMTDSIRHGHSVLAP